MTAHCCKAVLIPCPRCESPAGTACIKPFRYGGVVTRQCHVARANAFVKVCALLDAPAEIREYITGKWTITIFTGERVNTVAKCVAMAHQIQQREGCAIRVILRDGTVIREWAANEVAEPTHKPEACRDPACDCWPF